jgi:hypothetical protein
VIDSSQAFAEIWMYCMLDHGKGSMPYGPCEECVMRYAKSGPPPGRWNSESLPEGPYGNDGALEVP